MGQVRAGGEGLLTVRARVWFLSSAAPLVIEAFRAPLGRLHITLVRLICRWLLLAVVILFIFRRNAAILRIFCEILTIRLLLNISITLRRRRLRERKLVFITRVFFFLLYICGGKTRVTQCGISRVQMVFSITPLGFFLNNGGWESDSSVSITLRWLDFNSGTM